MVEATLRSDIHGRGPFFVLWLLVLLAMCSSITVLVSLLHSDRTTFKAQQDRTLRPLAPALHSGAEHVTHSSEDEANAVAHPVSTHEVKFTSEPKWEAWTTNVTQTWELMLPSNPLGQDDSFNDGIPYGIAMFHQIHCLHEIRAQYTSLLFVDGTTDEDRDFGKSEAQKLHIGHCFNWIRQALLCHADNHKEVLVESLTSGNTEKFSRVCGDSKVLYDQVGVNV